MSQFLRAAVRPASLRLMAALLALLPCVVMAGCKPISALFVPADADERELTWNLVRVAITSVEVFYELSVDGQISQEEAQRLALMTIAGMRYDDNNYFWITDTYPHMIMHPAAPQLVGTDVSDIADANGLRIFEEMVEVAETGGGFVEFQWARSRQPEPADKIAYVEPFEPWGWIIGTGIFVEDD